MTQLMNRIKPTIVSSVKTSRPSGLHGFWDRATGFVAQTSSRPYRGFPIRRASDPGDALVVSTPCRLEAGDTAGWKPALRAGSEPSRLVAQTSSLLYRGFPIRRLASPLPPCWLPADRTADCQGALRSQARRVGSRSAAAVCGPMATHVRERLFQGPGSNRP